jgi:hypothetical protein
MRRAPLLLLAVIACLALAACEADDNPANPTPAPFLGIAQALGSQGITIANVVSGEPGCQDQDLARTAVSFTASGLDQSSPTRIYLYLFRNRDTFVRLRSAVDACARAYATDPAVFGSVEASPYVAAGPGPWGATFTDHLRTALTAAAGNGG